MRVSWASAHSILPCLTKDNGRQFPQMSTCPRFHLKISSGNHLSIKYITERNIHGITWVEMFQMTISYLHLLNYSRRHKPALIFEKDRRIKETWHSGFYMFSLILRPPTLTGYWENILITGRSHRCEYLGQIMCAGFIACLGDISPWKANNDRCSGQGGTNESTPVKLHM